MKLFSNIVRLFGYVVAARFIYVAAINWHTTSTAINENRISRDIAVAGQTDSLLNQIFYNDILPSFGFGLLLLIPYGKLKRIYALPLICICLLLGMFSWFNTFRVYFLSERFVPEVVPHVVWISTAAFLAFLILFGIVALLNTKNGRTNRCTFGTAPPSALRAGVTPEASGGRLSGILAKNKT